MHSFTFSTLWFTVPCVMFISMMFMDFRRLHGDVNYFAKQLLFLAPAVFHGNSHSLCSSMY